MIFDIWNEAVGDISVGRSVTVVRKNLERQKITSITKTREKNRYWKENIKKIKLKHPYSYTEVFSFDFDVTE